MALYSTLQDYLNDQVREPIKKALEKGDKHEVMEILDFVLFQYIDKMAGFKAYEDMVVKYFGKEPEFNFKEYNESLNQYSEKKKWNDCEKYYSVD